MSFGNKFKNTYAEETHRTLLRHLWTLLGQGEDADVRTLQQGCYFREKEGTVSTALCDADWRFNYFVRDKAIGCGCLKRPDGWMSMPVRCADNVLVVVEVDEFEHRYNTVHCEIKRLEEIQVSCRY